MIFDRCRFLRNESRMELFYWEHQVPILTPDNVSIFDGETLEFPRVEILVVLRMRMEPDELPYIHGSLSIVAECQIDSQITGIGCTCHI